MNLLDCTLRDGGYYTHWDFPNELVNKYLKTISLQPIDYVEIGYRNLCQKEYFGQYFYTPISTIKWVKSFLKHKKLALMLDQKNCRSIDIQSLLQGCSGLVDLIRIAVDPNSQIKIQESLKIAWEIKRLGYKVALNMMYISKLSPKSPLYEHLEEIGRLVDFLYLVDSYGAIFPQDLIKVISRIRKSVDIPLGFHGHNNMELAFINSVTAFEHGVSMIDATIMGMGRGAGNLKTEAILSYVHYKLGRPIDLNSVGALLEYWSELYKKYQWGVSLPYMISGMNSLPQKDVMDWISKRRYPINAIVRGLLYKPEHSEKTYPLFEAKEQLKGSEKILMIGGGESVVEHLDALYQWAKKNQDVTFIHLSNRNISFFDGIKNKRILCLTGKEGLTLDKRLLKQEEGNILAYILPPPPHTMGIYIPEAVSHRTFELAKCSIGNHLKDAPLSIACEIAKNLGIKTSYVIGCDGYMEGDYALTRENQLIIDRYAEEGTSLLALAPTRYENISTCSLYSLLDQENVTQESAVSNMLVEHA